MKNEDSYRVREAFFAFPECKIKIDQQPLSVTTSMYPVIQEHNIFGADITVYNALFVV